MDKNVSDINDFDKKIIVMMIDHELTMFEALSLDMENNGVDLDSVLDMCDYLEGELHNLDMVEFYMDILSGRAPDQHLVKN